METSHDPENAQAALPLPGRMADVPQNVVRAASVLPRFREHDGDPIMLTTTLHALHEANACASSYKRLFEALGGLSYGKDTPITLLQILDICGLNDALWALQACTPIAVKDRFARELACDYAARVLPLWDAEYPEDKRPAQAIEVARRYAKGEATPAEFHAASYAASYAASDAASYASDAASYAASYAASDAASYAARDAEKQWQAEHLRSLLSAEVDG